MSVRPDVFELLHDDIDARSRVGRREYGDTLRPFDGRDSLWDAYEEALDLAVYLRKAIWERDHASEVT